MIEGALGQAACVVTLWSAHAVDSDWVRAESDEGRRRGILVPVLIEEVQPPLQFRLIETIDLTGWLADPDGRAFDRLVDAVRRHVAPQEPMARWREALVGEPAMDRRRSDPRPAWVSAARFLADGPVVADGDGTLSRYSLPGLEEQVGVECAPWSDLVLRRRVARRSSPAGPTPRSGCGTLRSWRSAACSTGITAGCSGARWPTTPRCWCRAPRDGAVCVWDLDTGTVRHLLSGHRGAVWSVALLDQSDRVLSASDDQTVRVWSLRDGRARSVLRGHTAPVMTCVATPDGAHAVSAGYDRTIRMWDLRSAEEVGRLEGSSDWILSLAVTPDGVLVLAGTSSGEVLAWDRATGELVARIAVHQGPVMSLDFRADAGSPHRIGGQDGRPGLARALTMRSAQLAPRVSPVGEEARWTTVRSISGSQG